jgi:tetratricopeptide (TPR) repeat protein
MAGVKRAAQAGIEIAERAERIAPESSEAHRLLGELLGQLIPHVFAGGMRYGARSTNELGPAHWNWTRATSTPHIARARSHLFAPAAFGGDKQKALQHLARALELDPQSDTAHLWRAQVYAELKETQKARMEIEAALRLNPRRAYTRYLARQMGGRE